MDDGPSFVVEHLATFTVSQQNEVMYPADGMRRLLHMEKTSGIWTQKMMLRLDREWVTIQDFENGEVVERFPLNLIVEPTAFTSVDPKDLYNNIFIFVVGEDPLNRDPPEMHIFQCVGVSSELVAEDMKMYMAGNYRPSNPSRIPPPPNKPPPEPPLNGVCIFFPLLCNEEPVMFNRCFYYCCYAGQPRSFHASHQRRRQFNFERTLREGRDGVEPLLRRHRALHRPFATRGRGSPRARTPQKVCRFFCTFTPQGVS